MFDFSKGAIPQQLERQLRDLAAEAKYQWIERVVDTPLDAYVQTKLPAQISKQRFAPWRVHENISEAGRILNSCLERRNEILQLEVQGIQTALDLQLSEQVQSYDLGVSKALLKAARAIGNLQAGDADTTTLDQRDALITQARLVRLNLHNRSGSALNFGERVDFLRNLYSDNVALAYERLYAVWLGMDLSFKVSLPEPPAWLPSDAPLAKLVTWLRTAMVKLDYGDRTEATRDVFLFLDESGLADDALDDDQWDREFVERAIASGSNIRCTLDGSKFGAPPNGCVRIIGLGAAVVFQDVRTTFRDAFGEDALKSNFRFAVDYLNWLRQTISFTFRISLPTQSSKLPGLSPAEQVWSLEPVVLSGVGGWTAGSQQDSVILFQDRQFVNASPIGEWNISVDPVVATGLEQSFTSGPEGLIPEMPKELAIFRRLLIPHDVVLRVRVAVRP